MSLPERRVWNAERFGYDVDGPCWACQQPIRYFVDEDGTPLDIAAAPQPLDVEQLADAELNVRDRLRVRYGDSLAWADSAREHIADLLAEYARLGSLTTASAPTPPAHSTARSPSSMAAARSTRRWPGHRRGAMARRGFHDHYPKLGGRVAHAGPADACDDPSLGPLVPASDPPAAAPDASAAPDARTTALIDAYWAHREVPGRHGGECCQSPCFPDIVERWVTTMVERIAAPPQPSAPPLDPRNPYESGYCPICHIGIDWHPAPDDDPYGIRCPTDADLRARLARLPSEEER